MKSLFLVKNIYMEDNEELSAFPCMKNPTSGWINSPLSSGVLEIKNDFNALFLAWRIELKF